MLNAGAVFCGGALLLGTVLGFAGALWWPLDLFAHFRVQQMVLSAAGAALLFVLGWRKGSFALAVCVGVNALVLVPYIVPVVPESCSHSARAMTMNVHISNRNFAAVTRLIRDGRPDFASRRPCVRCEILRLGEAGLPSVLGEFEVKGSPVTLVGTHPLPPVGAENARQHADQLRAIGEYLARIPGPKILLGDLNATPWSTGFRALTRRTGLRDSGIGYGMGRTWPVGDPLLGIPIDHFLHSPGVVIVHRKRWQDIGSDHFPLQLYFTLQGGTRTGGRAWGGVGGSGPASGGSPLSGHAHHVNTGASSPQERTRFQHRNHRRTE